MMNDRPSSGSRGRHGIEPALSRRLGQLARDARRHAARPPRGDGRRHARRRIDAALAARGARTPRRILPAGGGARVPALARRRSHPASGTHARTLARVAHRRGRRRLSRGALRSLLARAPRRIPARRPARHRLRVAASHRPSRGLPPPRDPRRRRGGGRVPARRGPGTLLPAASAGARRARVGHCGATLRTTLRAQRRNRRLHRPRRLRGALGRARRGADRHQPPARDGAARSGAREPVQPVQPPLPQHALYRRRGDRGIPRARRGRRGACAPLAFRTALGRCATASWSTTRASPRPSGDAGSALRAFLHAATSAPPRAAPASSRISANRADRRCGATRCTRRSRNSTRLPGATGPRSIWTSAARACAASPRSTRSACGCTNTCNGRLTCSSRARRSAARISAWRSASTPISRSPSVRTAPRRGPTSISTRWARAWAPRPTSSTSRDRTGACRRSCRGAFARAPTRRSSPRCARTWRAPAPFASTT